MKIGIIGTGNVGCACAMAAVNRGSAREIVLVNRSRKTAEAVATDMRYGTPLGPRVDIVDGDYDDLKGAGIVSARIAEMVLNDERAVVPIGSYQKTFGVTLSLPSIVGRHGVIEVLEPEMSDEERERLRNSADALNKALERVRKQPRTKVAASN